MRERITPELPLAPSNYSGIAPGTEQHALGSGVRVFAEGFAFLQLRYARLQRHQHIVAGVAVGHGEHVQVVNCILISRKGCRTFAQHPHIET